MVYIHQILVFGLAFSRCGKGVTSASPIILNIMGWQGSDKGWGLWPWFNNSWNMIGRRAIYC